MRYRTINEKAALEQWGSTITEATGVANQEKLAWMSNLLQINENVALLEMAGNINESYGSQGPEAVPGMGPVAWPGVGQAHGDILGSGYTKGSGDMPNRQLAMAMNVAAYTIGLDLLPVLPIEFPSTMFGYLDYVYAGRLDANKADQGDTEIYIELSGAQSGYAGGKYSNLKKGDKVFLGQVPDDETDVLGNIASTLYGTFLGKHRINGNPIVRFEGVVALTGAGLTAASRTYTIGAVADGTPNSVLKVDAAADFSWTLIKGTAGGSSQEILSAADANVIPDQFVSGIAAAVSGDLVSAVDMHVPEFSNPSATYDGNDQYSSNREDGEDGTQNIVSLRMFSTSVEAGEVQVLGELTRTQIKDLAAYGQDGMGQLYKAAQNELTQTINKDILKTLFRLGVDSHSRLNSAQGVNLNLFIADPGVTASKNLSLFGLSEFKDIDGVDRSGEFLSIPTSEANTSAENNATRSRRILTRILAASNIISNVGRHGAGDFAVVNTQLATAIQDIKGFQPNPFDNSITLDKRNLYSIGTVQGGIVVYVDPNMNWNDNRVLVGRKGTDNDPGLKMFIYTLGESVETLGETSMAPKILVSSRYSLIPCGFYPQAQYITFGVSNDFGLI